MGNLSKKISMNCPNCGSSKFIYDDNNPQSKIECANCKKRYSREEILRLNDRRIKSSVDEMKTEVFKNIQKEFRKMFK